MFLPDPKLTCDGRCSSPFKPSSGCTVTTIELVKEAELAIRTFQQQHDNAPVYVISDQKSNEYLNSRNFAGKIHLFVRELKVPDSVKKHNEYHRPDAIAWKMEVFEIAVNKEKDSVFFDADLIFLAPLSGPEDCEVALSHNLPALPAEHDGKMHGFFNAGLVWTCNPKYPEWWRHQYLNTGGFYEQVGMNLTPRLFRTGFFDFTHNYGFWRGPVEKREVRSFHAHLGTKLDSTMPDFMLRCVRRLRREIWTRMQKVDKTLAQAARKLIGHPDKVFFIHFGKAGGVYSNEAMIKQILPDYQIYDSWKEHLNRDWSEEELNHILTGTDVTENSYLHQHHISISRDQVLLAKAHGWKTFMYLRDPGELICSLWYWRKKTVLSEGRDWMFNRNTEPHLNMKEFWYTLIGTSEKKLWALPDYTNLVDKVQMFSDDAVANVATSWFGYRHTATEPKNVSGNPGLQKCLEEGVITQEMVDDLHITPEYIAFKEFTEKL